MTTQATTPPGATLHLGGDAWGHPDLEGTLTSLDDVIPYPGNPRRGDQDNITASVRDHGLYAGVVAQRSSGHILVGNHRRHALVALGAERVPVVWVDVDDERAAAIVARDNQTSDRGTYDTSDLLALLAPMEGDPDLLALSGYAGEDLDALRRHLDNLTFTETAGETPEGTPIGDAADPIDLDGDADKITVTLDPGHRQEFYALVQDLSYVRNVTNAHVKKAPDA